jgi:hypothetical protein
VSGQNASRPLSAALVDRMVYGRSGVCAVVQKPFSVFSCHELLIAFLAYRDDARRCWASSDRIFGVAERAAEVRTRRGGSIIRAALEHLLENSPSLAAAHFD